MNIPVHVLLEHPINGDKGHDADRHIDVEDASPGQAVDEETTQERSDHTGDTKDRAEVTGIPAAFARGNDVAKDGKTHGEQAAATESLDQPRADEHRHVLGQTTQHGAGEEQHDEPDANHHGTRSEVALHE